jgi:pyruvate kinase
MVDLLTKRVYRKTLTSIVASIQPQMEYQSLVEMVKYGVTIFRINFSWFKEASPQQWVKQLKDIDLIARQQELVLGIMLDTRGPEFRVRARKDDPDGPDKEKEQPRRIYVYDEGRDVSLTLDPNSETNDEEIAVEAPPMTKFKELGDRVVFGDGDYEATIRSRSPDGKSMVVSCERPLHVWKRAKVNFPGTSVTADALSDEDTEIIKFFLNEAQALPGQGLDKRVGFMFAQSFIKCAEDVDRLIHFLQNGMDKIKIRKPIVIAKLETVESSRPENLSQIIERASAVMIARGDLANETSRQEVPQLQRDIIKVAKRLNKPVLLATQVYASMRDSNRYNCTRPEAEDVRSALELGVDGFVLTGETSSRPKDPEKVIAALASQICKDEFDLIKEDERDPSEGNHYERLREVERETFHRTMKREMRDPNLPIERQRWLGTTDFAIAAVFRANTYGAIGLFPFTTGGGTVREMGRFYPETDIYPITGSAETAQGLLLCRCTHPVLVETDFPLEQLYIDRFKDLVRRVVNELALRKRRPDAHYAICTMAHPPLQPGGADTLLRIRID